MTPNKHTAEILWKLLQELPEDEINISVKNTIIGYLYEYQTNRILNLKDQKDELNQLIKDLEHLNKKKDRG